MLGELISQEAGHVTAMRVLPEGDGVHPVVEVSFQAAGQFLGADANDVGTYRSVARPDGSLFGQGQGVVMTDDGGRIAWKGEGVGKFTGPGSVSWRGAIYFQTESQKFARLNGVAGVFEYEADQDGNTTSKLYEWA